MLAMNMALVADMALNLQQSLTPDSNAQKKLHYCQNCFQLLS